MKRIWIVAFCLMAVLLFASCGELSTSGGDTKDTEPAPAQTEPSETTTPSEPTGGEEPEATDDVTEWESDVDFSEFETVPEPEEKDPTEPPAEPTVPATEPEVEIPTEGGDEPVESEPQEPTSPTDEENFQRPLVKP